MGRRPERCGQRSWPDGRQDCPLDHTGTPEGIRDRVEWVITHDLFMCNCLFLYRNALFFVHSKMLNV